MPLEVIDTNYEKEVELTASKFKMHILTSKSEKSIIINVHLSDVGVKFKQAATRKIIV